MFYALYGGCMEGQSGRYVPPEARSQPPRAIVPQPEPPLLSFPRAGTQVIECPDDTYILDAAEEAGIDLPYSCRAGEFLASDRRPRDQPPAKLIGQASAPKVFV
jgi:hypothetical protein